MPHTIRAHRHKRLSSARVRRAKTRQAAVFSSSHCRASRAQQPATADLTRTDWTKLVGSSVLGSKHSRPIVVGGMSSALNSAHGRHRPAVASAVEGRSRVGQSSKHIHRCATLACTASSTGPCENHQEWERPAAETGPSSPVTAVAWHAGVGAASIESASHQHGRRIQCTRCRRLRSIEDVVARSSVTRAADQVE